MSRKKTIMVSKKHGVNPTIPICFWCGDEKNEIALLGRLPGDKEAPRSTWLNGDYEPCEKCREKFEQGVLLAEALDSPTMEGQADFRGQYPTGRFAVLTETGVRKLFNEDVVDRMFKNEKHAAFLDEEAFEKLLKILEEMQEE